MIDQFVEFKDNRIYEALISSYIGDKKPSIIRGRLSHIMKIIGIMVENDINSGYMDIKLTAVGGLK